MNQMNPYYIHSSDNPGQVLVTNLLSHDGRSYGLWKCAMLWALSSKNKLGFVASWLLNSISKELAISIIYTSTARDIWLDLNERFPQLNGPCIF